MIARSERGDTIVEVLFALVVIGVTLAAAFSIANRSLLIGQAAHERNEALKLAESKLEYLRIAYRNDIINGTNSVKNRTSRFCMKYNPAQPDGFNISAVNPASGCMNTNSKGDGPGIYTVGIEGYNGNATTPKTYRVTVEWDRLGTKSTDKGTLELWYRPGEI